MTHTIDDLWSKLESVDNRLTILETSYQIHNLKSQRKRELIAYMIASGLAALSLLEHFIL